MTNYLRTSLTLMLIALLGSAVLFAGDPLTEGKAALNAGNVLKAIELLRDAASSDKKNPQVHFWLGVALQKADSLDVAIASFIMAREYDSTNAKVYEMLGDTYMKQNIFVSAMQQFQRSADFDSSNAKVYVKLARAGMKARLYNEAAAAYYHSLRLDTTDPDIFRELAKLLMNAKQYTNAIPILKHIVDRDASAFAEQVMFVKALYVTKHYEDIIPVAQKVVDRDTSQKDIMKMLAVSYAKVHDNKNAETAYKRLEDLGLMKSEDFVELAKAQKTLEKNDDALVSYEKAYRADTTNDDVFYPLGTLYMNKKQYQEAVTMFEKKIAADTSAGYRFGAYLNGGLCLMQIKEFPKACDFIRKSIELKPTYLQAWSALGACYSQMDSNDAKVSAFQKVIELGTAENGNGAEGGKYAKQVTEAYRVIGFQYLFDKKYPQSAEYLKKALPSDPKNLDLVQATATACQNAGEKDEAIKYYKRVLELAPKGSKQRSDAIKQLNVLGVPIFEGE
jgi:Tfp pilus assembly protein PilF